MKEHKYWTGMRTNRKEDQLFKNSINISQMFVIDNTLTLSLTALGNKVLILLECTEGKKNMPTFRTCHKLSKMVRHLNIYVLLGEKIAKIATENWRNFAKPTSPTIVEWY